MNRKSLLKVLRTLIIFLIFVFLLNSVEFAALADDMPEFEAVPALKSSQEPLNKPPKLNAGSAIVIDTVTGRVLYEKNGYAKRPMASTTKIMTAIIALENGNLTDMVTVSKRAAGVGGSRMGLKAGEKLALGDLMYGLMMESGNDAATAVAEHIGGSVDGFLQIMNVKAKELGALNTSFRSPHGLDSEGHYSTAYDMAIITRYAINNENFNRLVSTHSITVGQRKMHNTNEMLDIYYGADGVKTGYTGKANRCLVTSATRNNWRVISVVLGATSRSNRADDSKKLLDYAFNNYTFRKLVPDQEKLGGIPVIRGIEELAYVNASEEIILPLREDEFQRIDQIAELPDKLEAPVTAGTEAGQLKYMLDGKELGTVKLYTSYNVDRKGYFYYFERILREWLDIGQM